MGIGIQCDIATPALVKYGNEELKERYLRPTISGDIVACLGVSEVIIMIIYDLLAISTMTQRNYTRSHCGSHYNFQVGGGSDVAALKTTARRDGDEWVINGGKM